MPVILYSMLAIALGMIVLGAGSISGDRTIHTNDMYWWLVGCWSFSAYWGSYISWYPGSWPIDNVATPVSLSNSGSAPYPFQA